MSNNKVYQAIFCACEKNEKRVQEIFVNDTTVRNALAVAKDAFNEMGLDFDKVIVVSVTP